jgi:hypothetical protein
VPGWTSRRNDLNARIRPADYVRWGSADEDLVADGGNDPAVVADHAGRIAKTSIAGWPNQVGVLLATGGKVQAWLVKG